MDTCSALSSERKTGTAKSKTGKANLVAAIMESFAPCDRAFEMLTDANAMEMIAGARGPVPRMNSLYGIVVHANEVYGAMGVYMRIKGIVPPSRIALEYPPCITWRRGFFYKHRSPR